MSVWNWEDLDPEEDARRARAREAYAKMYPLNKDDPYGVKRLESCRAQTPAGIQRACNRVMRELGLGELTDGQGSEQSKESLDLVAPLRVPDQGEVLTETPYQVEM